MKTLLHLDFLIFLAIVGFMPLLFLWIWLKPFLIRNSQRVALWKRLVVSGLLLLELACIAYAHWIEPFWLEVRSIQLQIPGLGGSLRLVQLSDLHLENGPAWSDQVLQAVTQAHPDLLLLTGDYLNDPGEQGQLEGFLSRLTRLVGPNAVLAVMGNFEVRSKTAPIFARAGVIVLEESSLTFTHGGAALQIAGLSFHTRFGALDRSVEALARQVEPAVPSLLLYHSPDLAESPGIGAFDLVITGHTHGGQVRLPFYGALVTLARHGLKYQAGLYDLGGKTQLYINRGIGTEPAPAPRLRFLCRPEVTVFELRGGPTTVFGGGPKEVSQNDAPVSGMP